MASIGNIHLGTLDWETSKASGKLVYRDTLHSGDRTSGDRTYRVTHEVTLLPPKNEVLELKTTTMPPRVAVPWGVGRGGVERLRPVGYGSLSVEKSCFQANQANQQLKDDWESVRIKDKSSASPVAGSSYLSRQNSIPTQGSSRSPEFAMARQYSSPGVNRDTNSASQPYSPAQLYSPPLHTQQQPHQPYPPQPFGAPPQGTGVMQHAWRTPDPEAGAVNALFAEPANIGPWEPNRHAPHQPIAGSSRLLSPTPSLPEFSGRVKKDIDHILNSLLRWEVTSARTMIEGKLRAISSDEQEQFILISALRNQIHGMASADMGNAITTWAQTISVDRAKEGRDLRSATERELQERVSQWKSDPSFNEPLGEVLRMLPYAARRDAASIYVIHGNYSSVLFKRVFKDPRGPVNAINAIRNILVTLNENQRYQAIWNWDPTQ